MASKSQRSSPLYSTIVGEARRSSGKPSMIQAASQSSDLANSSAISLINHPMTFQANSRADSIESPAAHKTESTKLRMAKKASPKAGKKGRGSLPVLRRRGDFVTLLEHGQRVKVCDWLLVNFISHSHPSLSNSSSTKAATKTATKAAKGDLANNTVISDPEMVSIAPSSINHSGGVKIRCGWTLPRAVGGAVVRNRLRRWSRVYFRARLKTLAVSLDHPETVDVNLVFRKAPEDFYKKLKYDNFSNVLDAAWIQIERRLKSSASTGYRPVQGGLRGSSRRGLPI